MDTIWKTSLRLLVVLCRVLQIEQFIYIAEITLCEIVCWTGSLCRELCSNAETIMEHKPAVRPMCRQTSKRICDMGTVTTGHQTIHALLIRCDTSLHFIESKSLLVTIWSPDSSISIVPGHGLDYWRGSIPESGKDFSLLHSSLEYTQLCIQCVTGVFPGVKPQAREFEYLLPTNDQE
jgi:hypothetical protein